MLSNGAAHFLGPRLVHTETFNGQLYVFTVGTLKDFTEKANFVLSKTENALTLLKHLKDDVPDDVRDYIKEKLLKISFRQLVLQRDDEKAFDATFQGYGYSIWRCLRDHHAEFGQLAEGVRGKHFVNGRWYSMTPDEGIDAALNWYEQECDNPARLNQIIGAATEKDLIPLEVAEVEGQSEGADLRPEKEAVAPAGSAV